MTHLKIEQNTGVIEEVPSSVIKKLYDLAISGTLDVSSNLKGRLSTTATYESYAQYLTSTYSELYITANKYYVDFVDPLVESRLLAFNIGDGTGVTLTDMLNATISTCDVFYNTAITSFDEFLYFTKPSFTYTCQNFCQECKQLTSITYPPQMRVVGDRSHVLNISLRTIDFRNTVLTTIGGAAFEACTSLESVYLPNTCTSIENYAFNNSSALTTIDTSNVVTFGRNAFERCTALLSIDLSSATSIGLQAFKDCTNLTTVTLNPASTSLPQGCFSGCSKLETINLSEITRLDDGCLSNCTKLDVVLNGLDFSKITHMYYTAIRNTKAGTIFDVQMPAFTGDTLDSWFKGLNIRSISNIPSITKTDASVFQNCPELQTIDLSLCTNLTSIERFLVDSRCPKLKKIILPQSVTSFVSSNSWDREILLTLDSQNIDIICYAATPPTSNGIPLTNYPAKITVYVPDASVSSYLASSFWNVCTIKGISLLPS